MVEDSDFLPIFRMKDDLFYQVSYNLRSMESYFLESLFLRLLSHVGRYSFHLLNKKAATFFVRIFLHPKSKTILPFVS